MLRHVAPSIHPTYVELRLWFVYLFIGKFTVCCTTPAAPKYPRIALHAPLPLPTPRFPLPTSRIPIPTSQTGLVRTALTRPLTYFALAGVCLGAWLHLFSKSNHTGSSSRSEYSTQPHVYLDASDVDLVPAPLPSWKRCLSRYPNSRQPVQYHHRTMQLHSICSR
jgi:hypothetical protein